MVAIPVFCCKSVSYIVIKPKTLNHFFEALATKYQKKKKVFYAISTLILAISIIFLNKELFFGQMKYLTMIITLMLIIIISYFLVSFFSKKVFSPLLINEEVDMITVHGKFMDAHYANNGNIRKQYDQIGGYNVEIPKHWRSEFRKGLYYTASLVKIEKNILGEEKYLVLKVNNMAIEDDVRMGVLKFGDFVYLRNTFFMLLIFGLLLRMYDA
ncbi:MAG: hypothetical protein GY828_03640 [Candidatus Gracilibacteria bacterium]|nr:hypothetical protein [Candidatus Gracilibacteria bacterium]